MEWGFDNSNFTNKSLKKDHFTCKLALDLTAKLMEIFPKCIQSVQDEGIGMYKAIVVCDGTGMESSFPYKKDRKVKTMASELASDEEYLLPPEELF